MRKLLLLLSSLPFAAPLAAQQVVPSPERVPDAAMATRSPKQSRDAMSLGTLPKTVLFDRPREGELWALGTDWKASFDPRGFTFLPFFGSEAPRNFPLRVELASVTVGGATLPLTAGEPQVAVTTVRIDRGSFVETIATDLRQVEQSFVFSQLPNRGAIAVDITMTSELSASPTAEGLRFANEHGAVGYEKAVAIDAAGATLALAIEWDGDSAHITIPATFVERAKLPLVLDPILATNPGIAPGQGQLQRLPDTATLQSPDRALVVWQRQWSVTDQDCFAEVLDGSLSYATGAPSVLDFTSLNWVEPRAASSANARKFLVVAQIDDQVGNTWIGGRLVGDNGVVGAQLDIERGGVVGLPGNNFRPDVGGDSGIGSFRRFNVVWEHETAPGNRDIHYKLVRQDGTLPTANPTVLASLPENETFPSISKSNWEVDWHVAWQRQWPAAPFDQDIWEARIAYFGTVAVAPQVIAGTTLDELRPSVSSVALPQGYVGGANAMVAYERVTGGQTDIYCAVIDYAGGVAGGLPFNLSAQEAGGIFAGRNQIFPEVDSDGVRFVVGYSEFNGTDYDTYVSTLAFDPVNVLVRIDEARVLLGGTVGVDDYWTRISAWHDGAGQPSPAYVVAGANIATNDIAVWNYGGYGAGPFFTTRSTLCNSLPNVLQASGTPVIGQSVQFTNSLLGSAILGGFPINLPLLPVLGCNCTLGVDFIAVFPSQFTWAIPGDPQLVGTTFSMQGIQAGGTACIGLNLTDTIDFTIR